ncbi:TPA: phage tail protein, partial [Proteus mirabilis]
VSCFYGSPSTGVPGFPSNGAGWQSTYSGNRRAMLFMDTSGNLLARFSLSNNIVDTETPWRTLWSSNNTTVDSNGFIKRASPIIDINPDGTFTTNDESEGATVTRVAQGEYLIEGVLGFNSDAGWGGVDGGIEIPLDVNKQPLIWVDSKVMEDGSILVRTYHRTHPNAPKFARNDIDGYKDGDPIDIPDGRFISVRVQMPEQSIYNVRMHEMEEAQKAEEERRQKEEEENQDTNKTPEIDN